MFDTKIAIVVRDDLAVWQKLNVTAFLTSGILAENPDIAGKAYEDGAGNTYSRLSAQPVIVLSADHETMAKIHRRGLDRNVGLAIYIEDMFETRHDEANRATVKRRTPDDMRIVGLAMRDQKKIVDKITKGARLHA